MSGQREPDACTLAWCDEAAGHDGPHRHNLLDTFGLDVHSGRPVVTQLWLQGESARVRALVLVTGKCETGLTWRQAGELTSALSDARRKYA